MMKGCDRFPPSKTCSLAECAVEGQCAFPLFATPNTDDAFEEALKFSVWGSRPSVIDEAGALRFCEQCNGEDGKAVTMEFVGDGPALSTTTVWAHNPFNTGVCRWVYMCESCLTALKEGDAWFDITMYQPHPECLSCRNHTPNVSNRI